MSEIRITTTDLLSGSGKLNDSSAHLNSIAGIVSGISSHVGNDYDGQFREAVERIIGGDGQAGSVLARRAAELGEELEKRAAGFEAANNVSSSAMASALQGSTDSVHSNALIRGLTWLANLMDPQIRFLLGMGSVGASAILATGLSEDIEKAYSALYLASHLRWTALRPNSIVFTGPNWMRKALKIKEATRVIKPSTLSRSIAWIGAGISAGVAFETVMEELRSGNYGSTSNRAAVAAVDGSLRFAISAIGTVGIPLVLGATLTIAGAPVLAGGAAILIGSVVFGMVYEKTAETYLWKKWQQSSIRVDTIGNTTDFFDQVTNQVALLKRQAILGIRNAFEKPIRRIIAPAQTQERI